MIVGVCSWIILVINFGENLIGDAYFLKAAIAKKNKNLNKAIQYNIKALDYNNDPTYLEELANLFTRSQMMNSNKAYEIYLEGIFSKLAKISINPPKTYYLDMARHLSLNHPIQALNSIKKAHSWHRYNPLLNEWLGYCYYINNEPEKAEEAFRMAIDIGGELKWKLGERMTSPKNIKSTTK